MKRGTGTQRGLDMRAPVLALRGCLKILLLLRHTCYPPLECNDLMNPRSQSSQPPPVQNPVKLGHPHAYLAIYMVNRFYRLESTGYKMTFAPKERVLSSA